VHLGPDPSLGQKPRLEGRNWAQSLSPGSPVPAEVEGGGRGAGRRGRTSGKCINVFSIDRVRCRAGAKPCAVRDQLLALRNQLLECSSAPGRGLGECRGRPGGQGSPPSPSPSFPFTHASRSTTAERLSTRGRPAGEQWTISKSWTMGCVSLEGGESCHKACSRCNGTTLLTPKGQGMRGRERSGSSAGNYPYKVQGGVRVEFEYEYEAIAV